jgi:hypothetical protein
LRGCKNRPVYKAFFDIDGLMPAPRMAVVQMLQRSLNTAFTNE